MLSIARPALIRPRSHIPRASSSTQRVTQAGPRTCLMPGAALVRIARSDTGDGPRLLLSPSARPPVHLSPSGRVRRPSCPAVRLSGCSGCSGAHMLRTARSRDADASRSASPARRAGAEPGRRSCARARLTTRRDGPGRWATAGHLTDCWLLVALLIQRLTPRADAAAEVRRAGGAPPRPRARVRGTATSGPQFPSATRTVAAECQT